MLIFYTYCMYNISLALTTVLRKSMVCFLFSKEKHKKKLRERTLSKCIIQDQFGKKVMLYNTIILPF